MLDWIRGRKVRHLQNSLGHDPMWHDGILPGVTVFSCSDACHLGSAVDQKQSTLGCNSLNSETMVQYRLPSSKCRMIQNSSTLQHLQALRKYRATCAKLDPVVPTGSVHSCWGRLQERKASPVDLQKLDFEMIGLPWPGSSNSHPLCLWDWIDQGNRLILYMANINRGICKGGPRYHCANNRAGAHRVTVSQSEEDLSIVHGPFKNL